MRVIKLSLSIISTIIVLFAYNQEPTYWANGGNSFDAIMAFFCFSLTLIVLHDNWKDNFARLVFGTTFLMTINNLLDELYFNPLTFDSNEMFFGACIATNFIINIFIIFYTWKIK